MPLQLKTTSLLSLLLLSACGTTDPVEPPVPDCESGEVRACYTGPTGTRGVGTCAGGQQLCVDDTWTADCAGQQVPGQETCNGLDDDCNGQTDENTQTITCGEGICARTVSSCESGLTKICTPGDPQIEICNGLDDNCDGTVDEGCDCIDGQTQPCFPGVEAARNVGVCADGSQLCVDGQWGTCLGAVLPQQELCNGLDDDCDGANDNGDPEAGQPCATGAQGACGAGLTACIDGQLQCPQTVQPTAESCNGIDDDCDGQPDQGNPGGGVACSTGGAGACAEGTLTCANGQLQCVQVVQPSVETCNGIDDDCDGVIDQGNPGGGVPCHTGMPGACAEGALTCADGHLQCLQLVQPSPEVCNGADDDCDGQADQGNPGGGASCNTGLQGVCAAGTTTCASGHTHCTQSVQPAPEICDNGQDEDCDGVVDNGCSPGGTCAHDKCASGAALASSCDPCVQQICAADPFCCTTQWDSQCVQQVQIVCGQTCTSNCAHPVCQSGAALQSGCEPCVTQICAADSFCCTTQWDSQCVQQVQTVCGQTCSGNTCAHSHCSTGAALQFGCSPCVTQVCNSDPFCCSTTWDASCVQQANTLCGQACP